MGRMKVNLKEKVQKELPEFVSEVDSLSVEQINGRLAQLAKDNEELEQAKESDSDLEEAQERASQLAAPYKDGRKMIRMKSKYLVAILKDKGSS